MGQHLDQPGDMVELLDFCSLTHIPLHDERDRSFRILPSSNPGCRPVYFGSKRRPIRIMDLRFGEGRTCARAPAAPVQDMGERPKTGGAFPRSIDDLSDESANFRVIRSRLYVQGMCNCFG